MTSAPDSLNSPGETEPDPLIGTMIGERYRLESILGTGGMGTVYLAEHVLMEKKVALKVLLGLGAEAEADLAARPSHHDLEGEHDHEDFDTFIVELPVFDSPQHLVDRLVKVAETHDILRMKGFVDIAGKPMRLLVQGVGARVQHQYDRKWPGERRGRLVVIGEKGFDRDAISELIRG